jgi:uncharacterized membrane protein YcaP (DUF421 family)
MYPVLRGLLVYLFLWAIFRLMGKRALAQATTFDLVLLLIISETTQQAMVQSDYSMTNAGLLIVTLVAADFGLNVLKNWFPAIEPVIDGMAIVIVKDGKMLHDRMRRERVDASDILEAARSLGGIESIDQIRLAVLERDGQISIVPHAM